MQFLEKLKKGISECQITHRRVLIGLSGGADSIALTRGLLFLQAELNLELVAAHLNHQLRNDDSLRDAEFVERFCQQHQLPLFSETASITKLTLETGNGIEETAREVRYEFLKCIAHQQNCTAIAVGHHADDQVETVLHHLLRGTGLQGIAGMPWSRQFDSDLFLIRPMLEITRQEINDFLREHSQEVVYDESNQDTRYTRNRLRHELLPLLKNEFSPNIEDAMLNLSRQARESQEVLEQEARVLLGQVLLNQTDTCLQIDKPTLAQHPRHLIREVFVQLWRQQNWSRQRMTFTHWDRLAGVILGEHEGTSLPGPLCAKRVKKQLHIVRD